MSQKTTTTMKATSATVQRGPTRPRLILRPLSSFCCLWLISIIILIFSSYCCTMVNAEYYSSVDSLKILGNMEVKLIENYREYLKLQKRDMAYVQSFINEVKNQHTKAKKDKADYIENPINAFTLIKRMVNDWKNLYEILKFQNSKLEMEASVTQFMEQYQLPDENELKGAVRGLARLQTIYKLKAEELSNGERYGDSLKWRDCFEIGASLFDEKKLNHSIDWLELSLLKLENSTETEEVKYSFVIQIREYLALTYQSIGDSVKAMEHLDYIVKHEKNDLIKNLLFSLNNNIQNYAENPAIDTNSDYARLCRGERLQKSSSLTCKLVTETHKFFILNPLQVEPLNLNPPITLYHNLINDKQIEKLLQENKNKMQRSKVIKDDGTGNIAVELRVSQQTWLDPKTSAISVMMYRFVSMIANFNMSNAETLQVANYGIGGQYESHYDFFGNNYKHDFVGDRIATNMYYLSNVDEGGFTVFPKLDTFSKPVKGSMVMWYNLHKSLDQDYRTLHAGCPVLKGSKIISNIWTHSGYQEFVRPCELFNDEVQA